MSQEYNLVITVSESVAILWDLTKLQCIHILKMKQTIGSVALHQHRFVVSFGCNFAVYSLYGEKVASFEPMQDSENENSHAYVQNTHNDITCLLFPDQTGINLSPTKMHVSADIEQEFYTSCQIFSGHKDGMVRVWSLIYRNDLNCFKLIRVAKLRGHTAPICAINVTGNGNMLLSGDQSGKLIKWGLSKQSLKAFHHLSTAADIHFHSTTFTHSNTANNTEDNESKQSLDIQQENAAELKTDNNGHEETETEEEEEEEKEENDGVGRRATTAFFNNRSESSINKESYGDVEMGETAIQRRAQKDEIKSKYQAFQLHFNHVCTLQETLQEMSKQQRSRSNSLASGSNVESSKIAKYNAELIKNELKSSLEILKRCKNELDDARMSRPRIFCKFNVHLINWWQLNVVTFEENESVRFKVMNNEETVGCYNSDGKRIGIISNEQKMALAILMKEGVLFEGVLRKKVNDFEREINVVGYTWVDKTTLLNKLKSLGLDLQI